MIKPVMGVAATTVVAVLAWKILAVLLLPVLGLALGFAVLVLKALVTVVALAVAWWAYRRLVRPTPA